MKGYVNNESLHFFIVYANSSYEFLVCQQDEHKEWTLLLTVDPQVLYMFCSLFFVLTGEYGTWKWQAPIDLLEW